MSAGRRAGLQCWWKEGACWPPAWLALGTGPLSEPLPYRPAALRPSLHLRFLPGDRPHPMFRLRLLLPAGALQGLRAGEQRDSAHHQRTPEPGQVARGGAGSSRAVSGLCQSSHLGSWAARQMLGPLCSQADPASTLPPARASPVTCLPTWEGIYL